MTDINFTSTKEERAFAERIADRAASIQREAGQRPDRISILMDILATHANGCPLRLADLANADDYNFAHDVFGIGRHLDRETGKLTGHFLPRFAAAE